MPLPCLLTVGSEVGEPRYPSLRRIRQAFKVEIPTWTASDLTPAKPKNEILSLSVPKHEVECEFVMGEEPNEAGINLALKLREGKLI
jgi:electron transfer flavoprotein alpha/beta subunit